MLNITEAAKLVGRNPETIRRMRKSGEIKAYKRAGSKAHYFKRAELERAFKLVVVEKPSQRKALTPVNSASCQSVN